MSDQLLNFGWNRKIPVIIQTETSECGLACLAMVMARFGLQTDMLTMRRYYSISTHGMNMKQLLDISRAMGFTGRALRLETWAIKNTNLPLIVHWGMNHFVVLKRVTNKKFIINDPAVGERSISIKEFNENFTGFALEIFPNSEFVEKKEQKKLRLGNLWNNLIGLKRSLFQIIVLSLVLQLASLVSPIYIQTVVDEVVVHSDYGLLKAIFVGFFLLLIIEVGIFYLRELIVLNISSRLNIQMSSNMFRHLIRLPMEYFLKRHMGDIVSRFGALGQVRDMITNGLVSTVIDGLMVIITIVAMVLYSVKLTIVVVIIIIVYMLIRWALYYPIRDLTEESIVARAKESSHFMESMRAIQTIKVFQKEDERQSQWLNKLADAINKDIKMSMWHIIYNSINRFVFGADYLILIFIAGSMVIDGVISVGMMFAFISYKIHFTNSFQGLVEKIINFKMLGLYLNRLADIAFTPIDETTDNNKNAGSIGDMNFLPSLHFKTPIEGGIRVSNLAFRFGDLESFVFKDINFSIQPGETVAIIGPSGCGKTTLMKCLMGLIKPTEGTIYVDEQPIGSLPNYRASIAGVMQDDQLISGDIASNIACFAPTIEMERVIHCAKDASIHEEISAMSMGYGTLVNDMGVGISGGQKQRIILARALYRNPRILYMDEATSHLDVNSESIVNGNIKKLNITRVLIAHRPETIKSADRIIDLSQIKSI